LVARPFEEPSASRAEPPGPPAARTEGSFAPPPDEPGPDAGPTASPTSADRPGSPSTATPGAGSPGAATPGAVVARRDPTRRGDTVPRRATTPRGETVPASSAGEQPWRRSAAGDFRAAHGSCRIGERVPGPAGSRWEAAGPAGQDADAWKVGFSPTGEALPDALTDVLLRGSHWVRSAQRVEAQRRERSAAIAAHVEAQIAAFLELCAEAELVPPVTMRVVRDVPRLARHRGEGRPRAAMPASAPGDASLAATLGRNRPNVVRAARIGLPDPAEASMSRPAGRRGVDAERGRRHGLDRTGRRGEADSAGRSRRGGRDQAHGGAAPARVRRRDRLAAWPLLYWRCESFPSAGRSLHLFVEPGGRTFEGRDDPAPLTVLGGQVRVWPVDAPSIVEGMAEVDARRCALHLVDGMARLLWRAGVGL